MEMEVIINWNGMYRRNRRIFLLLTVHILDGRCVLMAQVVISWSYATIISLFSALVGYFVFLFIEIPMGDTLKDTLDAAYQLGQYFNINLIIFLGLIIIFAISFVLNILFLREYQLGPKLLSNFLVLILTCILLFVISGISVITKYSDTYSQLDLLAQIKASENYYSFFSIYILPNPTWFWFIALIMYNFILIIFIKFLYIKKKNVRRK